MLTASIKVALLAAASVVEARSLLDVSHIHGGIHRRQDTGSSATTLAANAIQTGSSLDGSTEIGAAEVGQAKSQTSTNNFINNCAGKTLTNGLQITTGSCNGITMGDIPAKTNMVSSIITFPLYGSATIQSDTTFNISVQMSNLVAGSFTNADSTYYAAPQALSGGNVVGHTHVTVQDMGSSLNPTTALDATQFAFFKGINDAGNGQGLLQATVTGGLPAGNYRVCTMASSSNHQPVLMPVAQRGTADDCTKFTVIGSGTTANAASNDGSTGQAAAALAASAVADPGPTVAVSGSAAKASSTQAANGNGGKASSSASEASTSKAANGNGSKASSSASEASTSKASKDTKATTSTSDTITSTSSEASSTTKAGKGGKAVSSVSDSKVTTSAQASSSSLKVAPFANTTSVAGKGGKGGKASQTSVTLSSVGSEASATSKVSSGGKAANSQASSGVVVEKVTIIETFFIFVKSLGGLPPSVGKQGEQFVVLEEVFEDISSAATAACGHQFDTCVSFSGPGFSFEECTNQQDACTSAASTASAPASPSTVTGTATVPVSATTLTGSVIAQSTVSISVTSTPAGDIAVAQTTEASSTEGASDSDCSITTATVTVDEPQVTSATSVAVVQVQTTATEVAIASETENACTISTGTVFVDAPAATSTNVATSVAPFSNSTATASSSSSSSTSTSSSGALGGIAAPAVTDSGDSTRPFEVNGNTFVNKAAAIQRSCDIQNNQCSNAANAGGVSFTVADCQSQQTACNAAAQRRRRARFV